MGRYPWELLCIVVALMSGGLSLLREYMSLRNPDREISKKRFWVFFRIAFVFSAALAWHAEYSAVQDLQSQLDRLKHEPAIADLINRALAQLGDRNLQTRIAGITALEPIGETDPIERQRIVHSLVRFLANEHPWRMPSNESNPLPQDIGTLKDTCWETGEIVRPEADVEAALTTLNHLTKPGMGLQPLEVEFADLKAGRLEGANLQGANLQHVNFHCTTLIGGDLTNARIAHCGLQWTYLQKAKMQSAKIIDCDLTGAQLNEADLSCAPANQCSEFNGLRMVRTNFTGANLSGARFISVDVRGALFDNADLTGTDLTGAQGLECGQLVRVAGHVGIKLPNNLQDCRVGKPNPFLN